MKTLERGLVFLLIPTMIAFSGTMVSAEIHHVAGCTVCHYGLGGSAETSACGDSENLKMVRDAIVTPGSGEKPVVFTGAYVRGGVPYDGVCEVCHEDGDVDYHTNTGNGAPHFDGEDCISCHPHKKIYAGKDIFSASDTGLASHDTHMMDQTKGPGSGACADCHSATSPPVPGETILFADGNPLATTTACNTCHSDGGAFNGSQMAKVDWDDGVYESGGAVLKEGQEQWCIGCHDSGFSVCQGVSAPNVELYYTSGHGRPDAELECLVCHDAAFPHIDGEPRSYWFNDEDVSPADDNADMYDVVNSGVSYAAGYRLRYVDGKVPMMIPAIYGYTFDNSLDLTEMKNTSYRRCFNADCHDSFKIFSEGIGIYTNFTAREPDPPYSYSGGGEHRNLHAYHLTRGIEQWDSDWDVDTDTLPETVWGNDSVTTCPTCHNVHGVAGTQGSTNDTMVRDGSLVGRPGFGFSFVIEDTAVGGYPWVTSEGATASTSVGSIFRNGTGNNEMCFGCHGSGGPSDASFIAENVPVVYSDYHIGPDSQDTLTVAGTPWTPGELVGKYIRNVTDGYTEGGAIISNTANTATSSPLCCPGSGDCTWQDGDLAEIYEYHSYTDYYRPWQDFLASTVDMIWTYDSHGGKDYSLLSEWEQDTQIDITLANDVVVLSHGGLAGSIASGDTVTGQVSGATGVVVGVVTNSQICIDMTSGGFQNGEQLYKTQSVDYVVSASAPAHVGVMYLDCYDGPHVDRVALAGATTDGLHYRCIRSAADCAIPFAGMRETGAFFEWNQGNHLFKLNEDCARLENIGARLTFTSDVNKQVFQILGDYCYVLGCIAYDSMNDGTGIVNGFYLNGDNTVAANCIAHHIEGDGFVLYGLGFLSYFEVCNCMAIDNGGEGFKEENTTGNNYALNCVGKNNGLGDFGTGLYGSCNMSSDGTAPGTDSKTNKVFTNMWVEETNGSEDYHLSETGAADSDFQGGAYPGLLHPPNYVPTHDIDGEPRSIWYRGTDEAGPPGHGYDISTVSGSVGLVDGVAMNGLPGNPVTRENGSYSANVGHGWSGTVTPTKEGYTFDPPSRQYVNVTSDQLDEDYTPIWTTYTIGGSVGTLDGITMDGLPEFQLKTSGGGFYASTVGHGWSGTVVPIDYSDTYRFEPPSRVYNNVQSDQLNEDYTPILTHQICGHIYTVEGVVLSGLPGDPVTGGSTAYYCGRVDDGWSGTVTPIKAGYTFDPPFMVYENVTSSLSNQNYTPIPD